MSMQLSIKHFYIALFGVAVSPGFGLPGFPDQLAVLFLYFCMYLVASALYILVQGVFSWLYSLYSSVMRIRKAVSTLFLPYMHHMQFVAVGIRSSPVSVRDPDSL